MTLLHIKYQKLKEKRRRNIILNLICIAIAGSGLFLTGNYFLRHVRYAITNDAYIDQYISPVSIRVSGYIQDIRFKEHQYVNKGDTLVILDNREFLIKLKDARANLIDARASREVLTSETRTFKTMIAQQDANIAETKAKLWQAEQDFHRYERLLQDESVPQQQYDKAKVDYEAAKARYDAILLQKETAGSQYEEVLKKQVNADAGILKAEAALDLARLNLSYTVVTAPFNGYMGRRALEPGQYVSAGQTLSYIVRQSGKWITANYRETQISDIYIGQPVNIRVDGLPGVVLKGRVTAISEATGSKYSLVPTDNSAGNFVKVQQRIPVRIELEEEDQIYMDRLRAGMMVETEAVKKK